MRPTSARCEIFSFDNFDPLADVADHTEMIPIKGSHTVMTKHNLLQSLPHSRDEQRFQNNVKQHQL